MKIQVLGMDPSMRNWGLAHGTLDLETGELVGLKLSVVEPKEETSKQVRKNSKDLEIADILAKEVFNAADGVKLIFVETPVGSQSARAMASYGICVGIIGCMRAHGIQVIEVTAAEVKLALAGDKNASKNTMIKAAREWYPDTDFPMFDGRITAKAEHAADAIGSIHAGVKTPVFQNLLQILKKG